MTNNDNNRKRDTALEDQLKDFLVQLGKLVSKFVWDLSLLVGKGTVTLYRAIGKRRAEEARNADRAARDAETATEMAESTRQGARRAAGTSPTQFVERTSESDPEAASLLEDLLQQTAKDMQQGNTPQVENPPIDAGQAQQTDEMDVWDELANTTTKDASADAQVIHEAADIQDGLPDAQVNGPEPKPITYNTPDEQTRIQEQLRQREELLQQEQEQRKTVFEEKERTQQEKQAQMKADLERIRQEKREREARFQQAEAERKQREAQRQQQAASRLSDTDPDDASTDEDVTAHQQSDSET